MMNPLEQVKLSSLVRIASGRPEVVVPRGKMMELRSIGDLKRLEPRSERGLDRPA